MGESQKTSEEIWVRGLSPTLVLHVQGTDFFLYKIPLWEKSGRVRTQCQDWVIWGKLYVNPFGWAYYQLTFNKV